MSKENTVYLTRGQITKKWNGKEYATLEVPEYFYRGPRKGAGLGGWARRPAKEHVVVDPDELPLGNMTATQAYEYHERQWQRHFQLMEEAKAKVDLEVAAVMGG